MDFFSWIIMWFSMEISPTKVEQTEVTKTSYPVEAISCKPYPECEIEEYEQQGNQP
ncbi:hypothetical protein [Pleionea mediterranea]|uniref:Uncharacterized protein n=1 Tax=Pleionea mediterranea TaxID=523701 RepID=A0A316FXJ3_9GAMM|nr:hypothetical protein [Pleionea mediterranea]PWK52835.1 hypothetical protein C8D97_10453 [Pleionea mediterranea]